MPPECVTFVYFCPKYFTIFKLGIPVFKVSKAVVFDFRVD